MSGRPLSAEDLADRWGVTTHVLEEWRQQGKGPCFIHLGRLIRYPIDEVVSFEHQLKDKPLLRKRIPATSLIETLDKRVGRLRKSKFTPKKTQAIIDAYISHLFDRKSSACPDKVLNDFISLMSPSITFYDSDEIEIEGGKARLSTEVLFVDLMNNLDKSISLLNSVRNQAFSRLSRLNQTALLSALDEFGEMDTCRRLNPLIRPEFKSITGN